MGPAVVNGLQVAVAGSDGGGGFLRGPVQVRAPRAKGCGSSKNLCQARTWPG